MNSIHFELRGEHITLDALLKATGAADSGGTAKTMIQAGLITVDGETEIRRGRKLRAGQVVALGESQIRLAKSPDADLAGP